MILYNVTINVEDELHDTWLEWMLNEHIPKVMNTGMFRTYKMYKVLSRSPEETVTTYSIQYFVENLEKYEIYKTLYAPELQKQTLDKFGDRFTAFRTILEEL